MTDYEVYKKYIIIWDIHCTKVQKSRNDENEWLQFMKTQNIEDMFRICKHIYTIATDDVIFADAIKVYLKEEFKTIPEKLKLEVLLLSGD